MAKFYISITTYRTELLLTHFNQKTHFLFVFDINYKPLFVVMVYYPNHSYTQRITYTHACARARAHAHARTRIHTHIVPETPTNCCERTNFKRSSLNMRNITRQKVNHYHHWIPHLDSLPRSNCSSCHSTYKVVCSLICVLHLNIYHLCKHSLIQLLQMVWPIRHLTGVNSTSSCVFYPDTFRDGRFEWEDV